MPELPEVQTIVTGLNNKVLDKTIFSLVEHRKGTIENFSGNKKPKLGFISSIDRRGKYIIINTSNDYKLIVHLRMTGKLIYEESLDRMSSHERASIIFADESKLIFDDIRTFGKIQIYHKDDKVKSLDKLGVEPLLKGLTAEYLQDKFVRRKSPIKVLLLNQEILAGLGNIYVSEILYRAKILPVRLGSELSLGELKLIIKETREVLKQAIACNGTTISDYRSVEDKTGEFQNFLKVYGKKECECGNEITKVKLAGRSSFFCEKCQK